MRPVLFMQPINLFGVCLKNTLDDILGELRDEGNFDSFARTNGIKDIRQANSLACLTTNATDRKENTIGQGGQGWEESTEGASARAATKGWNREERGGGEGGD